MSSIISRRQFVAGTLASLACASIPLLHAEIPAKKYHFCAFEKPLVFLSYDELAAVMADGGFDGIEAAVRTGGHVLPAKVEEDLPRFVEALQKRNLDITIFASDIQSVDQPLTEKVMRTAAKLGLKRYRMLWYNYDLAKPILPQLDAIAAKLTRLVDLTKSLGMTALYQNHSGSNMVGAPLWDFYQLIKSYDPKTIGLAYDIRHATTEGGLSWPIQFKLIQSHLAAIYVKDFKWTNGKVESVPLGQGQVSPKFFEMVKHLDFSGPISLHVEYLDGKKDRTQLASAFKTDLVTLKNLLG